MRYATSHIKAREYALHVADAVLIYIVASSQCFLPFLSRFQGRRQFGASNSSPSTGDGLLQGPFWAPSVPFHAHRVEPTLYTPYTSPRHSLRSSPLITMFKRSFGQKDRVNKIKKPSKRLFRDDAKQKLREQLAQPVTPPSVE